MRSLPRVDGEGAVIKASGIDGDRPLMLLGLSGENVARLVAGEPIRFDATEIGLPPCTVVIMYGRTEADIAAALGRKVGL